MNKENIFTSTGIKILHHPEVVSRLQKNKGTPVYIEVAPTSRCQLSCVFCSNVNRTKHEELNFDSLKKMLVKLTTIGLKAITYTGGGDPTMYSSINDCINLSNSLKLDQGMITNGLGFSKIKRLDLLKWIRISMNCLDYVEKIDIPEISENTTLGFSYVINDKTNDDTYKRLHEYVEKFNPSYVRIVPNCQTTIEQQEINNKVYLEMVEKLGEPYFYQAKVFEKPRLCYWSYMKPFLLHDGYVYRCSSVVLNDDAERSFHSKYRWCKMEDLPDKYKDDIIPFETTSCDKCVFSRQNNIVDDILNQNDMVNFI
jgi:organic radical activating enzyme